MGIVREGGVEKLVLYDFGNVASLSRTAMDGLLVAGAAFQLKDAGMLAEALMKHQLVDIKGEPSEVKPVLVAMIEQGFEYVRTMDIKAFDPKKLDKESAHKMALAEEINGVLRAVTMAEGVCKTAYPGFDLQRSIDQYLAVHSVDILARRARRDLDSVLGLPLRGGGAT
jgi:predicted unusual protein kinase regulating ubiquinone biosynthesis (AarF/ABC1/UbiB family)